MGLLSMGSSRCTKGGGKALSGVTREKASGGENQQQAITPFDHTHGLLVLTWVRLILASKPIQPTSLKIYLGTTYKQLLPGSASVRATCGRRCSA